ncbi:MAG: tripartite tricarboxylate transporter substrate binding protein [Synergistales bacterium]|nr:tripartite tricarboxylate transporter substrate binding protein [Synergistales bacterium]
MIIKSKGKVLSLLLIVCLIAIFASVSYGETWKPSKPITLIIPSNPGGGHDNNARIVAKVAEKYTGQPINVVNQPAGGGVVAYSKMMTADPDGLTVGQVSISIVSDQYLINGCNYNQDSFKYIAQIAADPNNLVVATDGPFGKMNLEEFLEYARSNPGRVRIGVSGNWTNHDYTRHQIESTAGVKFQRVSIKGGANIVMAVLAGDLDAGVPYPSEVKGQVDAGKMKILAHNAEERLDLWPDVPTFKERGLDVVLPIWRIWVLPLETPQEILDGWYSIMEKTMNDPELKKTYADTGIGYAFKGPEETRKVIDKAHITYKKIIEEAGLEKK